MGLIACALEMVYRANRGRVALSFQEIGDSILPLFVEMIRWSAARRKDILITEQAETKAAIEKLQQGRANVGNSGASVGPSIIAGGIYYSSGANGSGNANGSKIGSPSLVSILKNEPLDDDSPIPPLRLNRNPIELSTISENCSHLADKLPQEFTIECIPNGTETSSFVDEKKSNEVTDQHDSHKEKGLMESNDNSTESTSTSEETPSADLPPRRERQVRFSDLVDTEMKMPSPRSYRVQEPPKPTEPQYSGGTNVVEGEPQQMGPDSDQAQLLKPRKKERYTHPMAVLKILKVLRYFSRVLSAMVPMAHFPGLLDELVFQMKIRKVGTDSADGILRSKQKLERDDDSYSFHSAKSTDEETGIGSVENGSDKQNRLKKKRTAQYLDNASVARMDAIATIVNLACAEENKTKLLQHPGLLDAVIHVAQHDTIDDAREHASIVLMNLALAEDNKVGVFNQTISFLIFGNYIFLT